MHLFYLPEMTATNAALDRDESKHALKVLRLKTGGRVRLVNGKGGLYEAEIAGVVDNLCTFQILSEIEDSSLRPYRLHLAVAPTKNIDRFEWFLEKATEIGIDEITPIICEHSERKTVNTERCERILVAAMKQSLKSYLPKINEPISLHKFLDSAKEEQKFIGYCDTAYERIFLGKAYQPRIPALILIGPEGDFSSTEVAKAIDKGYKPITLGNSRLRTETAAVAAVSVVQTINELFNL